MVLDATRKFPTKTIQDLKESVLKEWNQLSQKVINCFISSKKSQCEACVTVKLDYIRYYSFLFWIPQPLFHTLRLWWVLWYKVEYNIMLILYSFLLLWSTSACRQLSFASSYKFIFWLVKNKFWIRKVSVIIKMFLKVRFF